MLCIFSVAMRVLHNRTEVKGDGKEAVNFAKICKQTRQNSLVFSNSLLPKSEELVKRIKSLAIEVEAVDFSDWEENLDDMREKIDAGEKACKLLIHHHEALITEFKRSEDEAITDKGFRDLNKAYDEERRKYEEAAEKNLKNYHSHDFWAMVLTVPTLGIGTWIQMGKSAQQLKEWEENYQKAVACVGKKETAKEVFVLSKKLLLPAIQKMTLGLTACCDFLIITREKVSEMKGGDGKRSASRRYFKVMKGQAKELKVDCFEFLTTASNTRTNLQTIKYESCDEKYAADWVLEKHVQFR